MQALELVRQQIDSAEDTFDCYAISQTNNSFCLQIMSLNSSKMSGITAPHPPPTTSDHSKAKESPSCRSGFSREFLISNMLRRLCCGNVIDVCDSRRKNKAGGTGSARRCWARGRLHQRQAVWRNTTEDLVSHPPSSHLLAGCCFWFLTSCCIWRNYDVDSRSWRNMIC